MSHQSFTCGKFDQGSRGVAIWARDWEKSVSPDFSGQQRQLITTGYFLLFLAGGGLGRDGRALLLVHAADLGVFLAGLLLVGLRGFITHNFYFVAVVNSPTAWNFLRREGYRATRTGDCK